MGPIQIDWELVHGETQEALAPLANSICQRCPVIHCEGGRTTAGAWFLYSYHTFNRTDEAEKEAVVVGVLFTPSTREKHIRVRGDIGGEETGHTYFEVEEKEVPALQAAVLTASHEIADQLCRQTDLVINAFAERRSPPHYRGEFRDAQ
jgi:hypothetical protein